MQEQKCFSSTISGNKERFVKNVYFECKPSESGKIPEIDSESTLNCTIFAQDLIDLASGQFNKHSDVTR